jgi:hypothetical protein
MGNTIAQSSVNFDALKMKNTDHVIISTLPLNEQHCLIEGTLSAESETDVFNQYLKEGRFQSYIIIYGKNHHDPTIYAKERQLRNLGFKNVKLYTGGLFEWLLLQDVYGDSEFKTTGPEDILKYVY